MAWRSHVNCLTPTTSRADELDDQQRWRCWLVLGMFDVPGKTADRLYICVTSIRASSEQTVRCVPQQTVGLIVTAALYGSIW